MSAKKNQLKNIPMEIRLVSLCLLLTLPVFPSAVAAAGVCWFMGMIFYHSKGTRPLQHMPLNFHLNLVMTGFFFGHNLAWDLGSLPVLLLAPIGTLLLTVLLSRLFYYYWIPVLLLPSLGIFAMTQGFLPQSTLPSGLHISWQESYVLCSAVMVSGFISPVFLLLLMIGTCVGLLCQSLFFSPWMFSLPILATQGICFALCAGIFSTPSRRSIAWATLALGMLTWFLSATTHAGIEISLLQLVGSANAASLLAIYGARIFAHYPYYHSYRLRPESKLEEELSQWTRFRSGEARVSLPFRGQWKVSQGFDGAWTHQGTWRHGIDFVITDEDGKTFRGGGFELTDYYAFGEEVLAPTSGYVVARADSFSDNPVGSVTNQHNFGNYVIIRDSFGAHVLIGHLKKESLTVALYQYVEAGQVIGLCGNSGYSPQPHIHLHVQTDAVAGSPTIAFHLKSYLIGEDLYFHGVPSLGAMVKSLDANKNLARSLSFQVDETFSIQRKNSGLAAPVTISNQLDPYWGTMYFTDGQAKLFHHRDDLTFYFYRYEGKAEGPLFDLMTALPRIPLIFGKTCFFEDMAPVIGWRKKWHRWFALMRQIFFPEGMNTKTSFQMKCDILEVVSTANTRGYDIKTSAVLDPIDGFAEFTVGDRNYEIKSLREHRSVLVPDSVVNA